MVYCCVPNCRSRSDRNLKLNDDGSKVTFHSFPPMHIKDWALAIKRRGDKPNVLWTPPEHSKYCVCSRHFLPTDFKFGCKKKVLFPFAVPSIFFDDTQESSQEKKALSSGNKRRKKDPKELPKKSEEASNSKESIQIPPPSDPKVVQVWVCSKISSDSNPTVSITNECDSLPSFIKQALIEKEKIELTYNETNDTNINSLVSNGNLSSQPEEIHNNLIINNSVKTEVDSSNEDSVPSSSSTNNNVPCFESLSPLSNTDATQVFLRSTSSLDAQNTAHDPKIVLIDSSSHKKVKMCDASTSAGFPTWKDKLGKCRKQLAGYRHKIRILNQKNRRYKNCIINMKHSVFCELQNRRYLSQKPDYFMEKQGCLLDRHSIRECQSSDTEESDED